MMEMGKDEKGVPEARNPSSIYRLYSLLDNFQKGIFYLIIGWCGGQEVVDIIFFR